MSVHEKLSESISEIEGNVSFHSHSHGRTSWTEPFSFVDKYEIFILLQPGTFCHTTRVSWSSIEFHEPEENRYEK